MESVGATEEPSLFRGMKIAVVDGNNEYPVIGIDREKYVVLKDGQQETLSSKSEIQTNPAPRFSKQFIAIVEDSIETSSRTYQQLVMKRDQMRALQMTSRVLIDVKNETVDVEDYSSEPKIMDLDREIAEAEKNPDTVEVNLTISSPWVQPDLYLLGALYFTVEQDGERKPAYKGQLVEVGDVQAGENQEIELSISDLPPGIEVDRVAYHFYRRGEEIAN